MSVLIDSREQKYAKVCEYLADILPSDVDFNVPAGGLDHGADYIIRNENEMGIQRKEINDFVSSLDKLKGTLHDLRTNYELSALLIEGDWKVAGGSMALRRGGTVTQTIPLSTLHNFVLSQQIRGTFFLRTANLKETSYLLSDAHGYLDGSISPSRSVGDSQELLVMFPNIGPKKAERILTKFGTTYRALNEIDHWDEVQGIGPATVNEIDGWLRGE